MNQRGCGRSVPHASDPDADFDVNTCRTDKSTACTHESGGQYGYLWHVEYDPEMPAYTAQGAWCQLMLVIPSRRVVVVSTVDNSAGYDQSRVCDDLAPIVEEVVFGPLIS